jgi:hypothetical protein
VRYAPQHPQLQAQLRFVESLEWSALTGEPISKAILLVIACTCSVASAGPLDGTWVNTDRDTDSIVKVRITSSSPQHAQFEWWGRTHPRDSKYGPLKLHLFGDSTGDRLPVKHGYAKEDCGFAEKVFFMTTSGDQLVIECLTIFADDDHLHRSNYRQRLTFVRER